MTCDLTGVAREKKDGGQRTYCPVVGSCNTIYLVAGVHMISIDINIFVQ